MRTQKWSFSFFESILDKFLFSFPQAFFLRFSVLKFDTIKKSSHIRRWRSFVFIDETKKTKKTKISSMRLKKRSLNETQWSSLILIDETFLVFFMVMKQFSLITQDRDNYMLIILVEFYPSKEANNYLNAYFEKKVLNTYFKLF